MPRAPLVTLTIPVPEGQPIPKGKPPLTIVPACPADYRIANIRASTELGLPIAAQEDFHTRTAVIVAYGPSLLDTWEELKVPFDVPADIFTVSGAHSFLVQRGIRPYAHTDIDPRPHKAEMLTDICPTTRFYLGSRCHMAMFDRLKGYDIRMYHTGRQEQEMHAIREIYPGAKIISPAAMIGMQCVNLCFFLGYRKFILYGMDCCLLGDAHHAGFHPNPDTQTLQVEVAGRDFITTYSMICSMVDFFNIAIDHPVGTFKLRGDGMLQWAEKTSRGFA